MNLEISSNVRNRDRLMTFISARICLETKWRTQRFFLLTFALLEATAGLAIAQAQDAKVAPRLRIEALRQLAEVQIIQPLGNAEPQTPAEQFDRMIFQQDQSPDAARARLNTMLTKEIVEIDRSCALSPAQKHKLFLMGRGDIKRFFDRFETLKEKYLAYGQFDRTMNEDIISIQIILGCGLIHDDCLLHKSLPKALTGEQLAQFDVMIRERSQLRHAFAIERAVTILEQGSRFSVAGRQNLIALLKKEIRPARITGAYDFYYIFGQIGRLPREQIQPLLNDAQWFRLNQYQMSIQQLEPGMRKAGYFRGENDEDENLNVPVPQK